MCPENYVLKLQAIVPQTEMWARERALAERTR